jgi:hypothetical protein
MLESRVTKLMRRDDSRRRSAGSGGSEKAMKFCGSCKHRMHGQGVCGECVEEHGPMIGQSKCKAVCGRCLHGPHSASSECSSCTESFGAAATCIEHCPMCRHPGKKKTHGTEGCSDCIELGGPCQGEQQAASGQYEWVRCDVCENRRRLPPDVAVPAEAERWECSMATWSTGANCSAPEEEDSDDEDGNVLWQLLEDAYEAQGGDGEVCEAVEVVADAPTQAEVRMLLVDAEDNRRDLRRSQRAHQQADEK